jgi:hypothetical protein
MAWTSPGRNSTLTSRSAATPPKYLWIPVRQIVWSERVDNGVAIALISAAAIACHPLEEKTCPELGQVLDVYDYFPTAFA